MEKKEKMGGNSENTGRAKEGTTFGDRGQVCEEKDEREAEKERPTSRSPLSSYKVGHANIEQSQLKWL